LLINPIVMHRPECSLESDVEVRQSLFGPADE
jgi:hypothetical protein